MEGCLLVLTVVHLVEHDCWQVRMEEGLLCELGVIQTPNLKDMKDGQQIRRHLERFQLVRAHVVAETGV